MKVVAAATAARMSQVRRRTTEIGNRAPEEIDGVRQGKQRDDAGAARGIDAMETQKVREASANEAEGDDRIRGDEEGEEPRAFMRSR